MWSFTYDKRETGKEPVHIEYPPTDNDIVNEEAESSVTAIEEYIAEIAPAVAEGFTTVMNENAKNFCARFGRDFDEIDYPKFNFDAKTCEKALRNYFYDEYLKYIANF